MVNRARPISLVVKLPMILFVMIAGAACANLERSTKSFDGRVVRDTPLPMSSSASEGESTLRKRVVVLPFFSDGDLPVDSLEVMSEARVLFIEELNKGGGLLALTEDTLAEVVKSSLSREGYDLAKIAKPILDLGASSVIQGRLVDLRLFQKSPQVGMVRQIEREYRAVVEVKVVHLRTLNTVFNTRKSVQFNDQDLKLGGTLGEDKKEGLDPEFIKVLVQEAFLEFIPQVTASFGKVGWEGRIAATQGDRYFLNVGKVSGVQIGDILKVVDDGSEVYDPEVGTLVGRIPGRMKGTLEVVGFFGVDGAIAVLHSGAGFQANDRVELYQ